MRALFVALIIFLHFTPLQAQDLVTTVEGFPITIQYLAKDRKVADKVSSIAAQEIPRLSKELGLETIGPVRVFLISDMAAFQNDKGHLTIKNIKLAWQTYFIDLNTEAKK